MKSNVNLALAEEPVAEGYHLMCDDAAAAQPEDALVRKSLLQKKKADSPGSQVHLQGRTSAIVDVCGGRFNLAIAAVIVANAVVIGLQTEWGDEHFIVFEHIFTVVFFTEMMLKIEQLGLRAYATTPRNLFDAFLVATSTADLYVIPLVTGQRGVPELQSFKLLRVFRILRIVRLFAIFRQLALILDAFFKAFATVVWVSLLVLILDYVCAIFLTQLVGHNAAEWEEHEDDISLWFGHIGASMRTLFIIMTLSDWDVIVLTVSEKGNAFFIFTLAMAYVLLTQYTMLSLITGSISEALITAQRKDEEHKLQEEEEHNSAMAEQVRGILRMIDANDSGSVTSQEVRDAIQNPSNRIQARLAALDISMNLNELVELVERVGSDRPENDGEVSIDEVADALNNVCGEAKSHTVWEIKHLIIKRDLEANQRFDIVQGEVAQLALHVVGIEEKLESLLAKIAEGLTVDPRKAGRGAAISCSPTCKGSPTSSASSARKR